MLLRYLVGWGLLMPVMLAFSVLAASNLNGWVRPSPCRLA